MMTVDETQVPSANLRRVPAVRFASNTPEPIAAAVVWESATELSATLSSNTHTIWVVAVPAIGVLLEFEQAIARVTDKSPRVPLARVLLKPTDKVPLTSGGYTAPRGVKHSVGSFLRQLAATDTPPRSYIVATPEEVFEQLWAWPTRRGGGGPDSPGIELPRSETSARDERLACLVDSAMDAIIVLDRNSDVTMLNPAAERLFECSAAEAVGRSLANFVAAEDHDKLACLANRLDTRAHGKRHVWVPGGFTGKGAGGAMFPAEASLSRFEMRGERFYTVIFRDPRERVEAKRDVRAPSVPNPWPLQEFEMFKARHSLDGIVGHSEALRNVFRLVDAVAGSNATVLVVGETGVGKELVANAVHRASPRGTRPMVTVSCPAIRPSLFESEFFGHEKGAFTNATAKRSGRFTLAHGGTLFLDEIGELPLDMQPKLLRVLQEGEFEPVGSSNTCKVDVRVVAATNRDLKEEVRAGRFREDLYHRLNRFCIRVPPLRERVEDIGPLASALAEHFARRAGRKIERLSEECIGRLRAERWPGNVRELENVIERAVITARDGRLNLELDHGWA